MPHYKQYVEDFTSPGSDISIKVRYDVDNGNVETDVYPVVLQPGPPIVAGSTNGDKYDNVIVRGIPSGTFRQTIKLPTSFSSDPCDEVKFVVSGYSGERDRIVYLGDDLRENLNNNYGGCCFDENGNYVEEPKLEQRRTMDIKLEAIGFDVYGKPTWNSQNSNYYFIDCTNGYEAVGSIVRSETFTITFNGMSPEIRPDAPYLDDDIIVKLVNSNGTEVSADKDSTSPISMTATYPETVTIKVFGSFGKKLFPDEAWEYYFEKYDPVTGEAYDYTPVPEHLSIDIEVGGDRSGTYDDGEGNSVPFTETKIFPKDPNDFVDAYRIDQNNKSGIGTNEIVRDLSEEVPEGVYMLAYEADTTEREAGTTLRDSEGRGEDDPDFDPSTADTIRENHIDVVLSFSVTSSIPPIVKTAWALGSTYAAGDYVTNGGNIYHVDVGGTTNLGPTPPADVGPSGTGFFVDNSGITYRYVPSFADTTSFGAGDWTTTMYVINDQQIGYARFQELVDAEPTKRNK